MGRLRSGNYRPGLRNHRARRRQRRENRELLRRDRRDQSDPHRRGAAKKGPYGGIVAPPSFAVTFRNGQHFFQHVPRYGARLRRGQGRRIRCADSPRRQDHAELARQGDLREDRAHRLDGVRHRADHAEESERRSRRPYRPSLHEPDLSLGLLSKLVTDWIGSNDAWLKLMSTTYRVPVQPDHAITIHGFITNKNPADRTVEVDVWMENEEGERLVTGTATVEFRS
jgi:hypothetical protein